MDIFQKSITPDKPRVLAEEQIYVYVPMATSTNAGIASYNRDQFDIIGSEVSLKWPTESFAQGPIETPSIVKVLDNEFEYTGNIVDLISGNNKISSDKLEVQLKRILRDAYERPELVMLDPNYFVRTITEKNGKQYYKYNTTAIHYNMSQNLSEAEQAQARKNISASSILDNDATNERIDTIEINITNLDNKQNLDVMTDISITGTGDNRYITSTTKNIKTQVVSTDNDQLTLASDTSAGLMSVSDYQQLRTNTSKIEQLENKTSRLIYDGKSNPTASDINNFAVGEGYEPPFAGLSVVVAGTYHIWHYYANVGWKDDGLDIVQQFTNTTAGVIMGSELDGKIYAETDGTASVNGWGALKGLVSSIDTNMTNHINNTQNPHNVTKTQVGLSNVDNTSDIDKPISTAVQSALDLMLPRSEAPTKVSDLKNDAAYIKNNDRLSSVQIPYIYNVQRIYSVEDEDHLYGDSNGKTQIGLSSDYVNISREYPNTPTYIPVFRSERDGVRDVTAIQSASTKRLIVDGVEEPTFPSNGGVLRVVSEDDGSYIEANIDKLTVVKNEDGSNKLQPDSKSLIFNWNGLYLNNNEISPNTIRYDIGQTLTDEQKAQARANIGAGTGSGTGGGGTVVTVGGVAQETWNADAKLDKSFIKTVGDTKITVSMNSDNTPGIVASYEKSGMITDYVASVMTLENKEILQYISGAKADGTPVYNAMNINENGIQMYVTTEAVGGSGVSLTPDKIEISTLKLTYNGNEIATLNQVTQVTKEQIGLGNVDNTSDLNKPISTQTQTALDGLNQTITNNFNNLNSSIENETERATLAETEINSKIPNQASSTNQLADKAFVNSTINSSAAFFKGSFESKAALDAVQWQTTDSSLATYVSNNDYAYIEADETHNNEAWRYIYVKNNTVSEWQPQFRVNESPFTQAQLDAINSGATADLINSINSKLTQNDIVDETGDSSTKAISQRAATLGINAVQNNLNTHILDKNNPHQVTKAQIGLGNVDNTSDLDKPISNAVRAALNDYLLIANVDNSLNSTSVNPVQNKVLYAPVTFAESERQKSKNLFNINKLTFTNDSDVNWQVSNNQIIGASGNRFGYFKSSSVFGFLKPNVSYTLSYLTNSGLNFIYLYTGQNTGFNWNNGDTKTFTQSDIDSFINRIGIFYGSETSSVTYSNIQIEEGTVATDYQPYNGQITHNGDAPVVFAESERQKSKNLFNKDAVLKNHEFNGNTGEIINSNDYWVSDYIRVVGMSSVYISNTKTSGSSNVFYDNNYNILSISSKTNGVLSIPSNAIYMRCNGLMSELENDIQIEEGSIATEYQPYNGAIVHEKQLEDYVTIDTEQTISGKKTYTQGLIVSGRPCGSGDDEGIVITKADNSYAGLCLGSPTGTRSVHYLMPDNSAIWRWSNGSSSYDISHPQKAGTIALTSDIPDVSSYVTKDSSNIINNVAGIQGRLFGNDARSVNGAPSTYQSQSLSMSTGIEFKSSDTIGAPNSNENGFVILQTINPWGDASGGLPSQLSYGNGLAYRTASSSSAWNSWRSIIDSTGGTISGTLTISGSIDLLV